MTWEIFSTNKIFKGLNNNAEQRFFYFNVITNYRILGISISSHLEQMGAQRTTLQ